MISHQPKRRLTAYMISKELLMKLEPDERLVVGTAHCGQNQRTGEILGLVSEEDYLEIGGG